MEAQLRGEIGAASSELQGLCNVRKVNVLLLAS